jgi:hypothetical protein
MLVICPNFEKCPFSFSIVFISTGIFRTSKQHPCCGFSTVLDMDPGFAPLCVWVNPWTTAGWAAVVVGGALGAAKGGGTPGGIPSRGGNPGGGTGNRGMPTGGGIPGGTGNGGAIGICGGRGGSGGTGQGGITGCSGGGFPPSIAITSSS